MYLSPKDPMKYRFKYGVPRISVIVFQKPFFLQDLPGHGPGVEQHTITSRPMLGTILSFGGRRERLEGLEIDLTVKLSAIGYRKGCMRPNSFPLPLQKGH
jgi:hypothetical protein